MPVTFSGRPNQQSVYVDPAFRLLGREQLRDNVTAEFKERQPTPIDGKCPRTTTPLSKYQRSYSRYGSPEVDDTLGMNAATGDQACCDTVTDLRDDDNQTEGLPCFARPRLQDNNLADRDEIQLRNYLANKAFYTTSTQKLYQGVDWCNRTTHSPAPPMTSKELNADTVSFRFESKRYEPRKEQWQQFGSRPFSWDYVQTRDGHHMPGPVRFCSPHRKITHLPGYMGYVSGGSGEMDNPKSSFISLNKQLTLKPRYTDTARKGNIPGYTGCVLFYDYRPACSDDPEYVRSTTASIYRPHDEIQCNIKSPYKKSSPMSRMVTLTHPFNPFNKVY